MGEGLLIERAVNFPVLGFIAGEGAQGNPHGEAGGVGACCWWTADELEVERVGFSGDVSERNIDENHLNGVVSDFVVAETTGFGHIINVDLSG